MVKHSKDRTARVPPRRGATVKKPKQRSRVRSTAGIKGKKPAVHPMRHFGENGEERKVVKYQKHQIIFQQGDPADAVYYIEAGKVQISVVSKQGKERIIAGLEQNAFFGEGCLSGQVIHLGTATTTTVASVIKIAKEDMIRSLRDDPMFSELFMTFLLARNIQIEADLIDHLFNSSEKRLARILLMLSNIGEVGSLRTIPNVSQEILAARVGTTRSRINSFMNKFRKLGFIEYNGVLKINQSLMNVIVHD